MSKYTINLRYNPRKWHYWGRWNQVMLFTSPWLEFINTEIFKKMNLGILRGDLKILYGYYYFLENDLEKLYQVVIRNLKPRSKWFRKFFAICKKKTNALLRLENGSNLEKFIEEMTDFLGCSTLVELTDFCIEKYLQEVCDKKNLSFPALLAKMQPAKKTELMSYQEGLRKLKKDKINAFVKRFEWVGTHAFEGKPLTRKKVLDELRSLEIMKGGQKLISEHKRLKLPARLRDIIPICTELVFQRNNLIEIVDRVAYSYWSLLKDLGRKHRLTFFEIISLTHDELLDLIGGKEKVPKDVKKRKKKFGIISIGGKKTILLGKELEKELKIHETATKEKISEIKGTPAFPGLIRGKAKILQDIKDILKIKEGDVLVAPETTPDYILAMKKAVAFVTNQGGITSHAAIVSREMKKPCIIGTKIATKVLKDGDLVEVDANKGVVKLIRKK